MSVHPAGRIHSESCGNVVACGYCEVGHAVRTRRTQEVVQRDAQYVDGRRKWLARPMPPVKNLRERVPVREVELSGDHRREEHDIREGDGGWPCEVIRGVVVGDNVVRIWFYRSRV